MHMEMWGLMRLPVADPAYPLPSLREGLWVPYTDPNTSFVAAVSQPHDHTSNVLRFASMSRAVPKQAPIVQQVKATIGHQDAMFLTIVIKFRMRARSAYLSNYNTDLLRAFFGNTAHLDVNMVVQAHGKEGMFVRYAYVALTKLLDVAYLHRMICRLHYWRSAETRTSMVCADGKKLALGTDIAWTCTLREFAKTICDKHGMFLEVHAPDCVTRKHLAGPPASGVDAVPPMPHALRSAAAIHPCTEPHGALLAMSYKTWAIDSLEIPWGDDGAPDEEGCMCVDDGDGGDGGGADGGSPRGATEVEYARFCSAHTRRRVAHVFPPNSYGCE